MREHPEFDAICAEVDEFDTLPSLAPSPPPDGHEPDEGDELLDDQILGGLVSPY